MSVELAFDLALCGLLLAGLPFWARHRQSGLSRAALFTGSVGGGLGVLWGVFGRRGRRCRAVAMVTLVVVLCVFVRRVVRSWAAAPAIGSKGRRVASRMMILVVFCIGTLANLAQEGGCSQQ